MKLKIDNDDLIEEFFEDASIVGIVAPVKDYKFTWSINQVLGYKFLLKPELELKFRKKERAYFFSIFEFCVPGTCKVHYLYSNQNDGEYLLPEFKHLDYLWVTKGEFMSKTEIDQLILSLKFLPGVQLVTEMVHDKIKNKQSLIL
jgi:hypothetical protein